MVDLIQIDYDGMQSLITESNHLSEELKEMETRISSQVEVLRGGAWIGKAATHFYAEMDEDISPALKKLHLAFDEMSTTLQRVTETLRAAEEESAACVTVDAPAGPAPSAPSGDWSGESWASYVNKTSADQIGRGAGCVAFMIEQNYLPWVSEDMSNPPGNANQWADKAREWAAANPEYGVVVNNQPAPGAIAVYPDMGGGYGHVGKVTNMDGNQYDLISANTWANGNSAGLGQYLDHQGNFGQHNTDRYTVGDRKALFIHLPWEQVNN